MSKQTWKLLLIVGALLVVSSFLVFWSIPERKLYVVFCDVGQGDGVLIYRGSTQILIDGGPKSGAMVSCLERYLPFWDREIELVVLTHPQEDHYGGLLEVFDKYGVERLVANKVDNSTQGYRLLKEKVGGGGVLVDNPKLGHRYRLGLIYLDILSAESGGGEYGDSVLGAYSTDDDLNTLSVVIELEYGSFEALFTGDIGQMESDLVSGRLAGEVDLLKVPHHGSKNGLSEKLLRVASPRLAVISASANNSYGHPHSEVLNLLRNYGAEVYGTYDNGDVVVKTDGEKYWIK